ncbi:2OG-Fe(II) oxygenase [Paraglaciecola sp. 2405UD69-4]|uniref:2OG-Fe(II) oxygenase n=1 Tax=Paraglaciecola sp. 2405UD69-4 TaxID=3391836 RepID=UPI0039C9720C
MLKFNEEVLRTESIRETFLQNGKCRIEEFWEKDSAKSLSSEISTLPYSLAYSLNGLNREATDKDLAGLNVSQQRELLRSIHQEAAKGSGFLYGRFKISKQSTGLISDVLKLLNSESVLNFVREISGHTNIIAADAQVTRFAPGNFLTRHSDDLAAEGRKLAYVFSFSEQWHPDWGGLLQFYHQSGEPTDTWRPHFNSLTLFDVKHIHAVTCVAPFAPQNRYSITGWFKSKGV